MCVSNWRKWMLEGLCCYRECVCVGSVGLCVFRCWSCERERELLSQTNCWCVFCSVVVAGVSGWQWPGLLNHGTACRAYVTTGAPSTPAVLVNPSHVIIVLMPPEVEQISWSTCASTPVNDHSHAPYAVIGPVTGQLSGSIFLDINRSSWVQTAWIFHFKCTYLSVDTQLSKRFECKDKDIQKVALIFIYDLNIFIATGRLQKVVHHSLLNILIIFNVVQLLCRYCGYILSLPSRKVFPWFSSQSQSLNLQ